MTAGSRVDFLLAKAYDPDVRVRRAGYAIAKAGYRPRVLAWDRSGVKPQESADGPIRIHRIRVRSRPSRGWTQIFFLFRVAREYLRLMRHDPPQVIHAVDLPMLIIAIALVPLLAGRRRPAIVYDAFEIHALMGVHSYPRWLVATIRVAERYLPRVADLVITPGEDRRRYFADRGIASLAIPNWVDPPAQQVDRERARASLGIGSEFCIVYAGGLIGSRDLMPLIDHARRHPDEIVLIAGSGDAEGGLRRASASVPNVRLLGWVEDTTELFAAADALYYALKPDHPYASHAAPNNLYIAIANAVPLIYRAQGELAVVGGRHRIGEPFTDADTLEASIAALRDPAHNAAIRDDLRTLQGRYRWSDAARRLVQAYPRRTVARQIALVTRLWPTHERPGVGTFVRERTMGVPGMRVVKPRGEGLPRPMLYAFLLWDAIRRTAGVDGVEAHMILPTGLVGLIAARMRRVPLVVYSHGRDVRSYVEHSSVLRSLSRLVVQSSAAVITNSQETADQLRSIGIEPRVIVPGTDLSRFRPTPRPERRRVLYMGGNVGHKGYDVARELADTLIGPGINEVEYAEVARLMAEHDVLLVPSRTEAFGLVAVEAIASGRWVVANAVGGLREIVEEGVNGTLVHDGDFASALARVPDYDPVAISRTVERFSLERWQDDMSRVWDQVLQARQPR